MDYSYGRKGKFETTNDNDYNLLSLLGSINAQERAELSFSLHEKGLPKYSLTHQRNLTQVGKLPFTKDQQTSYFEVVSEFQKGRQKIGTPGPSTQQKPLYHQQPGSEKSSGNEQFQKFAEFAPPVIKQEASGKYQTGQFQHSDDQTGTARASTGQFQQVAHPTVIHGATFNIKPGKTQNTLVESGNKFQGQPFPAFPPPVIKQENSGLYQARSYEKASASIRRPPDHWKPPVTQSQKLPERSLESVINEYLRMHGEENLRKIFDPNFEDEKSGAKDVSEIMNLDNTTTYITTEDIISNLEFSPLKPHEKSSMCDKFKEHFIEYIDVKITPQLHTGKYDVLNSPGQLATILTSHQHMVVKFIQLACWFESSIMRYGRPKENGKIDEDFLMNTLSTKPDSWLKAKFAFLYVNILPEIQRRRLPAFEISQMKTGKRNKTDYELLVDYMLQKISEKRTVRSNQTNWF